MSIWRADGGGIDFCPRNPPPIIRFHNLEYIVYTETMTVVSTVFIYICDFYSVFDHIEDAITGEKGQVSAPAHRRPGRQLKYIFLVKVVLSKPPRRPGGGPGKRRWRAAGAPLPGRRIRIRPIMENHPSTTSQERPGRVFGDQIRTNVGRFAAPHGLATNQRNGYLDTAR